MRGKPDNGGLADQAIDGFAAAVADMRHALIDEAWFGRAVGRPGYGGPPLVPSSFDDLRRPSFEDLYGPRSVAPPAEREEPELER